MKYTATCQHCAKETTIGFEEWLELTKVMMTFSRLEKSQQELILLMVDGMRWRKYEATETAQTATSGDEK